MTKTTSKAGAHSSSFRDPAGFIFTHEGQVYRQVNQVGAVDYDLFMSSGLCEKLVAKKLLVAHKEVKDQPAFGKDEMRYRILQPDMVPFISYPYEWSFGQLKDAALLTLRVQRLALKHGMILKDASAFNVQFIGKQPIFIDTLSFKKYEPGEPWEGYKQFCEHFIAPLALASYSSPLVFRMFRDFLDGIPLGLAVQLLPRKARLNTSLLAHLYLHAGSQRKHEKGGQVTKKRSVSQFALEGLMGSLKKSVTKLKLNTKQTEWGDYYTFTNYSDKAFTAKKKLVKSFLDQVRPKPGVVWDLGANNGEFSAIAAGMNYYTVAMDIDVLAVEYNYRHEHGEMIDRLMLPIVQDMTNPSPSLGLTNSERSSLFERGPADVVMVLALIHHLAIGANVPLVRIAELLSLTGNHIIIEFVPKGDSKVDHLLSSREDIFVDYDIDHFEAAMAPYFKLVDKQPVRGSKRTLYLYKKVANG